MQGPSNAAIRRLLIRAIKHGTVVSTLRHRAVEGWIARGIWQPLDDDTRRWVQEHADAQDADLRPYFSHSWVRLRKPREWAQLPANVKAVLEPAVRQFDQRLTVTWSLCPACPEDDRRFVPRWGNTRACLRCRRKFGTEKRLSMQIKRLNSERAQRARRRMQRLEQHTWGDGRRFFRRLATR